MRSLAPSPGGDYTSPVGTPLEHPLARPVAGPEPWPANPVANAIRARPRWTAIAVALVVLGLSGPPLVAGLGEWWWAAGQTRPESATPAAIADGTALGSQDRAWLVFTGRGWPDLASRASRAGDRREPVPMPYLPVGPADEGESAVAVVVELRESAEGGSWPQGSERPFEVVATRGRHLPAGAAARFAQVASGTRWESLPLVVEGPPDTRRPMQKAVVSGLGVLLAALALLGATVGDRAAPALSPGGPPRTP